VPIVRVRQHVNPLSSRFQEPVQPPQWAEVFSKPTLPLHLDVGCGRGIFLLEMAIAHPNWNFLGIEIREPLVIQAQQRQRALGLTNLHYVFCNANNSLRPLLSSLPAQVLHRVSIQFPDPWFKKRHQKRRVVQPEMIDVIADALIDGGELFLQSDVLEVAMEMCDRVDAHSAFVRTQTDWLPHNPMPISTERENSVLSNGLPVYRALYVRQPRA
jgi:tRNA (guanine-N7-)-methyltransferase